MGHNDKRSTDTDRREWMAKHPGSDGRPPAEVARDMKADGLFAPSTKLRDAAAAVERARGK